MFHTSSRRFVIAALLALSVGGCNALRGGERCEADDATSCPSGQVCDGELSLCVVPVDAVSCSGETQASDCSLGQRCEETLGICIDDVYTLVVLGDKAAPPTLVQIHTLVEFVARHAAEVVNRGGFLQRPVTVERLNVDLTTEEATAADFATLDRPNVLGVITLTGTLALIGQQYLTPARTLMIGQFTSSRQFETYSRPWDRYAYGLIPTPRANFAMLSKFLSGWRPADELTGGDPSVLACERLGFVYREFASTRYDQSLIRSQIARYGTLSLEADIAVEGELELELEEIYEQLTKADVDCVYLGALHFDDTVNEAALIIGGHPAWREEDPGAKRIRWLLGNAAPLHRQSLEEAGLEDEVTGSLSAVFEVGGERSESAVKELTRLHDEAAAEACEEVGTDDCRWLSPEAVANTWFQRFAPSDDQAMLLLVAAMHAERRFGGEFGREELRDSFLSIVDDTTLRSACRRDALEVCVDRFEEGKDVHYFGLSGDLTFGEDGRAETYDEVMVLRQIQGDGTMEEVARFTSSEMLEAYLNASPKDP